MKSLFRSARTAIYRLPPLYVHTHASAVYRETSHRNERTSSSINSVVLRVFVIYPARAQKVGCERAAVLFIGCCVVFTYRSLSSYHRPFRREKKKKKNSLDAFKDTNNRSDRSNEIQNVPVNCKLVVATMDCIQQSFKNVNSILSIFYVVLINEELQKNLLVVSVSSVARTFRRVNNKN